MVDIIYIEADGSEHAVDVPPGESLMEGAVWNRVPGILGSCGGDGGCATCQVYVDDAWADRLDAASAGERNTLRFAFDRRPNSRLACQIRVTDALGGLILRLPTRQF